MSLNLHLGELLLTSVEICVEKGLNTNSARALDSEPIPITDNLSKGDVFESLEPQKNCTPPGQKHSKVDLRKNKDSSLPFSLLLDGVGGRFTGLDLS